MSVTTTASSSAFAGIIDTWRRFGVFDFILPFLLVFAIIYGVLERVKIFGDIGKRVNAIIAFTIAMITTLTGWFISFLTGYMPWVSIISIIIVTGLMLVAMFAPDADIKNLLGAKSLTYGAIGVVAAIGAVLLGMGAPSLKPAINGLLSTLGLTSTDMAGIVFFIAFLAVLFLVGKSPKSATPPTH